MKKDNRGFTLIELIISLSIFSLVVTAVFGFMLAGSRSYSRTVARLNMDLQAALTFNQLGEYIIDCNACLSSDGSTLYVVNYDEAANAYTAHVFKYRDGCIYYGQGSASRDASGRYTFTVAANDLLAENVSLFSVTPVSADGTHISSAVVSIDFSNNSASYSGKRTFALRNKPAIGTVLAG